MTVLNKIQHRHVHATYTQILGVVASALQFGMVATGMEPVSEASHWVRTCCLLSSFLQYYTASLCPSDPAT